MFQQKKETIVISEQEGLHLSTDALDVYDALALLEKENERLLDGHARATCVLVLYDKKGTEIFQQALSLPYEGKIEELLSSLLQGGNVHTKPKSIENKKNTSKQQGNTKLLFIVPVLFSIFAIGTGVYAINQKRENQALQTTVNSLKKKVDIQEQLSKHRGKVDVFSRYFLPKLFSDNKEGLKDYVSNEVINKIQNQKGQTQSVIQEDFQTTKKGFSVVYVCMIKDEKENRIKYVSFEIATEKESMFGYKIINVPTVQDY